MQRSGRRRCKPMPIRLIGDISLQSIDTALVMKVVEPIWATKPETANRVRGRIETILDWATVRGYRQGENPARWRGHLDKLLPSRSKVRKTQHHSALPYAELPAFLTNLREQEGIAARALEFTILTAGRTSEVIGARRSEFNRREKLWTIPARTHESGQGASRAVVRIALLSSFRPKAWATTTLCFLVVAPAGRSAIWRC